MTQNLRPPALDPMTAAPSRGSSYPEPFRAVAERRTKRALGDALGLANLGVNLVHLGPGDWSAPRHWHSHEDEFVYVLEGQLTLVTDEGEQILGPGMAAGFPAGVENGHHLINRGRAAASYLEVGDRKSDDVARYSDIDLVARSGPQGRIFTNRNGEGY